MKRSSTKELFTPFKDPKREFRSSRKHFKTLSLDKSRSTDFDLFYDQDEYLKEEVVETMAETIEQYMSKTRANYRSGFVRPKIKDKDHFELKGQFLKELRDTTFSGSDYEDVNEHIEKVLEIKDLKIKFLNKYCLPIQTANKMEEINNFQQEPDETLYQAWEKFKELLMKCAIPSKTVADTKVAIQEMAGYSQKWHNGSRGTGVLAQITRKMQKKKQTVILFDPERPCTRNYFDRAEIARFMNAAGRRRDALPQLMNLITIDVVFTTTAEALVMAKIVICANTSRTSSSSRPFDNQDFSSLPSCALLMDEQKEIKAFRELRKTIAFKLELQMLHLRAAFNESMGEYGLAL
nr:hypothetical protein [Tanacetum cinerariifolium]